MFFTRFVTGNIFSVAVIGIILLLKKLLKNRASLRFHYHIWFALLLSLAVIFMPASFFKWIDFGNITREITTMQSNISVNTASAPDMAEDWLYDFTEMVDVADKAELNAIFLIIWIIGALCVAVFYCFGGRKLKAIKRFAEPPPENIIALFNDCLTKTSVKQRVCLLQSDLITSPMSFGCRRCYIVLPSRVMQNLSEKEIEHILLHELMHIKHRDMIANFLFCTAQILYWFNPLIWWAFSKMRIDREAYCDWSVLNVYNADEERLCYGNGYVGNDTAYYWNGSNLKISPLEQVELLVKLYNNDFGFDEANVDAVKEAIFISDSNGNSLYGKTGTGKQAIMM